MSFPFGWGLVTGTNVVPSGATIRFLTPRCQSAWNIDPLSASNFDPLIRYLMRAFSFRI